MKKKYIHPMCKGHELNIRSLMDGASDTMVYGFDGKKERTIGLDDDDVAAAAKGGRSFFDE